jgi:hypothetical protein
VRTASSLRRLGALPAIALVCLVAIGCRTTAKNETDFWIGTWSAPSLSRPDTPIIITLMADGRASEEVGAYRGTGQWRVERGHARIDWASGWRGELRRTGSRVELRTWKAESDLEGPPDDVQQALRVLRDRGKA